MGRRDGRAGKAGMVATTFNLHYIIPLALTVRSPLAASIHNCHSIRHPADQREKQVRESFVLIVVII